MRIVWFIYPETANVRLEDMNSVFGDGTSVMPSPATLAEAESLFGSQRSPVTSIDLRRQGLGPDHAIPGLDIDPPNVSSPGAKDSRPMLARGLSGMSGRSNRSGQGVGGWISNMVKRAKGDDADSAGGGAYKQVGQDEH